MIPNPDFLTYWGGGIVLTGVAVWAIAKTCNQIPSKCIWRTILAAVSGLCLLMLPYGYDAWLGSQYPVAYRSYIEQALQSEERDGKRTLGRVLVVGRDAGTFTLYVQVFYGEGTDFDMEAATQSQFRPREVKLLDALYSSEKGAENCPQDVFPPYSYFIDSWVK